MTCHNRPHRSNFPKICPGFYLKLSPIYGCRRLTSTSHEMRILHPSLIAAAIWAFLAEVVVVEACSPEKRAVRQEWCVRTIGVIVC